MPGLVGFTRGSKQSHRDAKILQVMLELITHGEFYKRDQPYSDSWLCASRTHLGIIQKAAQPFENYGMRVWMDGEFYNQKELIELLGIEPSSDPAILLAALRDDEHLEKLRCIDGVYSAVVYDSSRKVVHLISDRYGIRHLFWTQQQQTLAWASEVKAMLALPQFEPRIDSRAANAFFDKGHLLADFTWLQGVQLLSPATVLTWDLVSRNFKTQRYWTWGDIKLLDRPIDRIELWDELARRFIDALERRYLGRERVGIPLSGGMDSRAILAALPSRGRPIKTFTFGQRGCDDIRFATKAARKKKAEHHVFFLDSHDWLRHRVEGVWWCDGELNLRHMHYLPFADAARDLFDISLDGLGADASIGGDFINRFPQEKETTVIENRVRRFTTLGGRVSMVIIEHRRPFFDNGFLELARSIPPTLRIGRTFYKQFLLHSFGTFFRSIPWQRTGVPIGYGELTEKVYRRIRGTKQRLLDGLRHRGFDVNAGANFADYDDWLTVAPARGFVRDILENPRALYPEFVSSRNVLETLHQQLAGRPCSELLCRYLTFEIWLQQLLNGKYRPAQINEADGQFHVPQTVDWQRYEYDP